MQVLNNSKKLKNLKAINETFFFLSGCCHIGGTIISGFFGSCQQIFLIPRETGILLANPYHIMKILVDEIVVQKSF